jgi:hypothetical protein
MKVRLGSSRSPRNDQVAHQAVSARETRFVMYAGPELLAGEHLPSGFDCGSAALNAWLVHRALGN